jgi:hypothetical protein
MRAWLARLQFSRTAADSHRASGASCASGSRPIAPSSAWRPRVPRAMLHRLPGLGDMGPITHAPLVNDLIAAHIAATE